MSVELRRRTEEGVFVVMVFPFFSFFFCRCFCCFFVFLFLPMCIPIHVYMRPLMDRSAGYGKKYTPHTYLCMYVLHTNINMELYYPYYVCICIYLYTHTHTLLSKRKKFDVITFIYFPDFSECIMKKGTFMVVDKKLNSGLLALSCLACWRQAASGDICSGGALLTTYYDLNQ